MGDGPILNYAGPRTPPDPWRKPRRWRVVVVNAILLAFLVLILLALLLPAVG